ncbi:hypothetical protein SMD44_p10167 (plasmid) [Streptomyces alboflavus]|uniref:Uncharacterized protein n=1 Tax=Streptomyces alboflavus TaxID=67267 RepID=A0A291W4T3_9ACTN|nr:hypothetical protein [Streptomyces alboflavus]ATM24666.1 hypothetical protein SMD44_p10167 [Streptomyces alboflavus]
MRHRDAPAPRHRVNPAADVPEGWVRCPVPPVPEGMRASSWRRTVTAAGPGTGLDAVPGTWLSPGDAAALPPGALLLCTDKKAVGTAVNHRTGRQYTAEDARVKILLVQEDGTLRTLWDKHYARSRSALGRQVVTKLVALLAQHPAPGGDPVLLAEAQRPNTLVAQCRYAACARPVAIGDGHLISSGARFEVEHWPDCSRPSPAELPAPRQNCDNCGRRGRTYEAVDSSGIPGRVCRWCYQEPPVQLSFA